MLDRLFQNWVYSAPPVALLVLGLYPFIGSAIELAVFLSLPIYLIHQFEEHDNNRFAVFINSMVGQDKRGLSPRDIWAVNIVFVWFFLLAIFYLSASNPAWGVVAAYLLGINGFVHIAWAVKFRTYNPGLWTAVFLFVPCAIWVFRVVPADFAMHTFSALLVLALHAVILILARRPAQR